MGRRDDAAHLLYTYMIKNSSEQIERSRGKGSRACDQQRSIGNIEMTARSIEMQDSTFSPYFS